MLLLLNGAFGAKRRAQLMVSEATLTLFTALPDYWKFVSAYVLYCTCLTWESRGIQLNPRRRVDTEHAESSVAHAHAVVYSRSMSALWQTFSAGGAHLCWLMTAESIAPGTWNLVQRTCNHHRGDLLVYMPGDDTNSYPKGFYIQCTVRIHESVYWRSDVLLL